MRNISSAEIRYRMRWANSFSARSTASASSSRPVTIPQHSSGVVSRAWATISSISSWDMRMPAPLDLVGRKLELVSVRIGEVQRMDVAVVLEPGLDSRLRQLRPRAVELLAVDSEGNVGDPDVGVARPPSPGMTSAGKRARPLPSASMNIGTCISPYRLSSPITSR